MRSFTMGVVTALMLGGMAVLTLGSVFGVPRLAPELNERPESDSDADIDLAPIEHTGATHSPEHGMQDLFAPIETDDAAADSVAARDRRPQPQAGRTSTRGEASERRDVLEGWMPEPQVGSRSSVQAGSLPEEVALAPQQDAPRTSAVLTSEQRENVTWDVAMQRLRALGVQHYLLTPGSDAGEYYFSCSLSFSREPQVIHRFEAEAGEPLLAVQDVLDQVENWMARTDSNAR